MHEPQSQERLREMLTDGAAVLVRLITLIPHTEHDARRRACLAVLNQVMLEINFVLGHDLRDGGGGDDSNGGGESDRGGESDKGDEPEHTEH